ncbi:polymer-forming cytoskeletal protein [Ectothiorhodospiraceae bacterium WFHF3C12]|nr:polymer-forming cytoskeletal protein [Ectothiorhodospiraceae bacterium WFHF3C12]
MFDLNKRAGSREAPELPDTEPQFPESRGKEPAPGARVREAAIIGPSIHIEGDLRGEEDLVIEGEVKGTIHLSEHSLTVGSKGKIEADVYAHTIVVDGNLEGDLYGSERVAIRKNGQVRGNIISPRVSLEDGGRFKGSVEMDEEAVAKVFGRAAVKASADTGSSQGAGASSSAAGQSASSGKPAADSSSESGQSGATGSSGQSGAAAQSGSAKGTSGSSGKGSVAG